MLHELTTSGRLRRGGFWLRHMTVVPLGMWLLIAAGDSPGAPYDIPFVAALVLFLVSAWGRRLHDRARSAWWLLSVFVPVLGAVFLIVECGLRGTAAGASRFGPATDVRRNYLAVRSSTPAASSK